MVSHLLLHASNSIIIEGYFSKPFVFLSVLFAVTGVYTAFMMHERIHNNSFFPKALWFLLASFALGFGIFSMHYMGMFAFELPLEATFNPIYTFISIVPILIAAYCSFYYSYRKNPSVFSAIFSSCILAVGVVSMHFIGMRSLIVDAHHHHHIIVLVVTFLIAFFANILFYAVRMQLQSRMIKLPFSILMGCMLSLTHYTAMIGMDVYVEEGTKLLAETIPVANRNGSAVLLTAVFVVILLFLLISSFADKYVQYRAEHFDILTKLPSIRKLEQIIEQNIDKHIAIIQIKDLHNCFEHKNYLFREEVIYEIAQRIEHNLSPMSILYRADYYQFVILSKNNDEHFEKFMDKIKAALHKPYKMVKAAEPLPPFMIVTAYKEKQVSIEQLFDRLKHQLDSLAYANDVVHFKGSLNVKSEEEEILEEFSKALYNNQMYLTYQPKYQPKENQFDSIEALIRWEHPTLGFVSPGKFIPILEKTTAIYDLTDWVIFNVAKQLQEWRLKHIEIRSISINIPGTYITNPRLKKMLIDAVTRYEISPSQIELEITETSYVGNIDEASKAVAMYRDLGFFVAIDDFGTGLSSLSYLKQLPINTLKIDKSFVDGVPYSEKDSEIIKGIISIANSLNLNIVIEGVEEKEQRDYIEQHFKNVLIQGYYYSKPIRAKEIENLFHASKNRLTVDI